MPTTRPWESASAPPELPGLSAASVWMTSSISRAGGAAARRHARPRRADHAGRHGAGQPERVADGDHERADAQRVGVAVLRRARHRPVGADDGQVGQRVAADDLEAGDGAVGERRLPAVASPTTWALVTGALAGQHHGRARRLAAAAAADAQRGDPRGQRLGDGETTWE